MADVIHESEGIGEINSWSCFNIGDKITYMRNIIPSWYRVMKDIRLWWGVTFLVFLVQPLLYGQDDGYFKIGDWRSYFIAGEYTIIEKGAESIIVANPYQLFLYYPESEERLVLNKVNGLSQTGISSVKYLEEQGGIAVGYENGNIDIVEPDQTINIPGIRNNENILESKKINDFAVIDERLYLAADFGMVEIDLKNYEFGSTLFTDRPVLQIVAYGQTTGLIGRTEDELYVLPDAESSNFADIHQWEIYPPDREGAITDMAVWNEGLYLVVGGRLYKSTPEGITEEVYVTNWEVHQIEDGGSHLVVTNEYSNIIIWDGEKYIQNIANCLVGMRDVVMIDENEFWYVSKRELGRYDSKDCNLVSLPGVPSKYVSEMAVMDGDLFVATGGVTRIFGYLFREDGFYTNATGSWKEYSMNTHPELKDRNMRDVLTVVADAEDEKVYFGTFWDGVIVYDRDEISIYDHQNSAIQPSVLDPARSRISDLFLDKKGNLWMANHDAPRPVVVKTADDQWYDFRIPQGSAVQDLVVDEYENIWMSIGEQGLLIFRPNDWEKDQDDETRLIIPRSSIGDGTGFDNARINDIVIDHKGAVWVGTETGPVVFDCGDFALEDICQGRKPVIEIDGRMGVLLRNENIKTIAIDAGNRKWIGTDNGVYVINNHITEIDHHFKTDNSPLPHNSISNIAIDHLSGEVYIATDGGLVSYRGESVAASAAEGKPLKIFPNPVPPEYDSQIGIQDMAENALVRITTLSGRLVYENRAIGGRMVWNQLDQDGRRVSPGIYLVFATSDDSFSPYTQTGKIFILN